MCGFLTYYGSEYDLDNLNKMAISIKYRGPDNTVSEAVSENVGMVFHRLSIIDVSENGNQPMRHPGDENLILVCNGEIYNYKSLERENRFSMSSNSDCEIILHLYKKYGIERTLQMLDGVFSFCLYDLNKKILYASRDPYGVRPAFILNDESGGTYIASEAKPLLNISSNKIIPFPPGHWWSSDSPDRWNKYHNISCEPSRFSEDKILLDIKNLLTQSVSKRMMADREIGCLLSGGLDSSLIASLVASMTDDSKKLKTFSIGMQGSPDLKYAQVVSDHINSDHHSIKLTEKEFLKSIETVIYNIESYDTTTVRASVGNYLVSKYIRENTDVKVVFNGDGADEVCMGYVYNRNAPDSYAFLNENKRLLDEIYLFDVLRSDRCISSNGLEARTPFLDKKFVEYYMKIPAEMKMFGVNGKPEKYLLRKAFEKSGLLPQSIINRHKCAFSDGVSSIENSWHSTLRNFIDLKVSDREFEIGRKNISHCTPILKESYYYRKIFDSIFGSNCNIIPHFWMPKWTTVNDPSARELADYSE